MLRLSFVLLMVRQFTLCAMPSSPHGCAGSVHLIQEPPHYCTVPTVPEVWPMWSVMGKRSFRSLLQALDALLKIYAANVCLEQVASPGHRLYVVLSLSRRAWLGPGLEFVRMIPVLCTMQRLQGLGCSGCFQQELCSLLKAPWQSCPATWKAQCGATSSN